MEIKVRTKSSIYKFEDDGTPKQYCGNTVISILREEDKEIKEAAAWVQEELKQTEFAQNLVFLPEDSFHMTWHSLCREIDRATSEWPAGIPRDTRMAEVDRILKERIDTLLPTPPVRMEIDRCTPDEILLRPADEESERILREFKEQAVKLTGIYHPSHARLGFHITVSYVLYEWTEEEKAAYEVVCARLTEELKRRVKPFVIPQPQFVVFNDMLKFHPELGIHDDLE